MAEANGDRVGRSESQNPWGRPKSFPRTILLRVAASGALQSRCHYTNLCDAAWDPGKWYFRDDLLLKRRVAGTRSVGTGAAVSNWCLAMSLQLKAIGSLKIRTSLYRILILAFMCDPSCQKFANVDESLCRPDERLTAKTRKPVSKFTSKSFAHIEIAHQARSRHSSPLELWGWRESLRRG